jgi:hypothetical protein
MKTLLQMFIRQGTEAGSFEISYKEGTYYVKIADFQHAYSEDVNFEYMLETTLTHYLKHKKCGCK